MTPHTGSAWQLTVRSDQPCQKLLTDNKYQLSNLLIIHIAEDIWLHFDHCTLTSEEVGLPRNIRDFIQLVEQNFETWYFIKLVEPDLETLEIS